MRIFSVMITAIAKQSIAVVNHPLILNMYLPPTNSISWSYINISANDYGKSPGSCREASTLRIDNWPRKQGVDMCWSHYLGNPDVKKYYNNLINQSYYDGYGIC